MTDSEDGQSAGPAYHFYALKPGALLNEFRIKSVLGSGGFGITYLAVDTLLEEDVAIKEYLPNELAVRASDSTVRAKTEGDGADFQVGMKTFLGEARLLARFRHRNIVHVRRFFELNGTGYIVQDYEKGGTLSQRLEHQPSLTEAELRRILAGVLNGLEVVHDHATLHRDLKPSNIILRSDGTPTLIDFGAARDFTGRHSRSITALGTPGYSPPEQQGAGGQQGPWTDFYALGAIAYRIVTGVVPTLSVGRLRKDMMVPATTAAAGKFSPDLLKIIDWMLRVDEAERPASVTILRRALEGEGIRDAPTTPDGPRIEGVTAIPAGSGKVHLAFTGSIGADVLEIAFRVTPPGRYLDPSEANRVVWSDTPRYHSISRVRDAATPLFEVGPDLAQAIATGTLVSIESRDGFIKAGTTWPGELPAKPVSGRRGRWIAAAVAMMLILVAGAWGLRSYQQYQAQKSFESDLAEAAYDAPALNALLQRCTTGCPPGIESELKLRLATLAVEEISFRKADGSLDRIKGYLRECRACAFKDQALADARNLEAQQVRTQQERAEQEARDQQLTREMEQAGTDRTALQRFLDSCGAAACQADLIQQAKERIGALDQLQHKRLADELGAAGDDGVALQHFLDQCGTDCPSDLEAAARRKLAQLAESQAKSEEAQRQAAAAARQQRVDALTAAGDDGVALQHFLDQCGTDCPSDLEAAARRKLAQLAESQAKSEEAQRQAAAAARQQRVDALTAAGDDGVALQHFLDQCGTDCPSDLEAAARRKLAQLAESQAKSEEAQRQAATAARQQQVDALAAAGDDGAALQRFLNNCGSSCPDDLQSSARQKLAQIVAAQAQAANVAAQQQQQAALEAARQRQVDQLAVAGNDATALQTTAEVFDYPVTALDGFVSAQIIVSLQACRSLCSSRSGCAGFDHSADGGICQLFSSVSSAHQSWPSTAATRNLIVGYRPPSDPPAAPSAVEPTPAVVLSDPPDISGRKVTYHTIPGDPRPIGWVFINVCSGIPAWIEPNKLRDIINDYVFKSLRLIPGRIEQFDRATTPQCALAPKALGYAAPNADGRKIGAALEEMRAMLRGAVERHDEGELPMQGTDRYRIDIWLSHQNPQ
ncbi:protein kinase domain-containing protein [Rhizobium ruizarguesonis]|uniref:protein kinase domain-containing protein n=1 Tax=Rhizobium ruizarguesonis TaxID=2081791 RepID=UPI0013DF4FEB|nr:protein kinase [Rhizobium ruizarguesonis]